VDGVFPAAEAAFIPEASPTVKAKSVRQGLCAQNRRMAALRRWRGFRGL